EHRSGLLRAHSPAGTPHIEDGVLDLGRHWRLAQVGINVKRYPTCYATHRSIDAMLDLVHTHDLKPANVEEIRVHIGKMQRLMLRKTNPRTGLEARFKYEVGMAERHYGGRDSIV